MFCIEEEEEEDRYEKHDVFAGLYGVYATCKCLYVYIYMYVFVCLHFTFGYKFACDVTFL